MRWPGDPEARRRMVEALLVWVEELDRVEPVPEGVDPGLDAEPPDLHSTVAALEALRGEVGIQGRAFSKLAAASADRDRAQGGEERAEGRREVLAGLLEARDRFSRTLTVFHRQEGILTRGFPGARRRREAVAGLLEGLRLSLEATDEALRGLDCREIPASGRPFDPKTMRAVEAADPGEGVPGSVVEVVRAGWLLGNEVLRPAEVRAVPAGPEARRVGRNVDGENA